MPSRRFKVILWLAFCFLQALQLTRFYSAKTQYYLTWHERNPFQERVLPILFLKPVFRPHWIMHILRIRRALSPLARCVLSPQLAVAVFRWVFVEKLYYALPETGTFYFLVYPMFLFANR
jgi:hypothetical protein